MSPTRRRLIATSVVVAQIVLLVALVSVDGRSLWDLGNSVAAVARVGEVAFLVLVVAALAHLGPALTPLPTPTEHAQLQTAGLYRVVRHPTYSAIMGFALCRMLPSPSMATLLVGAALFALFSGKARWEESLLRERFAEYESYAARAGRFMPFVGRRRARQ